MRGLYEQSTKELVAFKSDRRPSQLPGLQADYLPVYVAKKVVTMEVQDGAERRSTKHEIFARASALHIAEGDRIVLQPPERTLFREVVENREALAGLRLPAETPS